MFSLDADLIAFVPAGLCISMILYDFFNSKFSAGKLLNRSSQRDPGRISNHNNLRPKKTKHCAAIQVNYKLFKEIDNSIFSIPLLTHLAYPLPPSPTTLYTHLFYQAIYQYNKVTDKVNYKYIIRIFML